MEENNKQEGVVSENQNAPLDNDQTVPTAAPSPVMQPTEVDPTATDQSVKTEQSAERSVETPAANAPEASFEKKPESLPAVEVADKKGSVAWRVVFVIIIILIIFFLVKFFSNNETGINVLDTIANVTVKVSDEPEQGTVNIVEEDGRIFNDQVLEQDNRQPQLNDNQPQTDNPSPSGAAPAVTGANASTTKIIAYYPNSVKNPGAADCSLVFPLERNVEKKYDSNIINTVRGLLVTLTAEETDLGFTSNIPAGTMLKTVKIGTDGVAEVDFTAALNRIGGSCAVMAARAQIEQTLKQFGGVKMVVICVDGNCDQDEILQP